MTINKPVNDCCTVKVLKFKKQFGNWNCRYPLT